MPSSCLIRASSASQNAKHGLSTSHTSFFGSLTRLAGMAGEPGRTEKSLSSSPLFLSKGYRSGSLWL